MNQVFIDLRNQYNYIIQSTLYSLLSIFKSKFSIITMTVITRSQSTIANVPAVVRTISRSSLTMVTRSQSALANKSVASNVNANTNETPSKLDNFARNITQMLTSCGLEESPDNKIQSINLIYGTVNSDFVDVIPLFIYKNKDGMTRFILTMYLKLIELHNKIYNTDYHTKIHRQNLARFRVESTRTKKLLIPMIQQMDGYSNSEMLRTALELISKESIAFRKERRNVKPVDHTEDFVFVF